MSTFPQGAARACRRRTQADTIALATAPFIGELCIADRPIENSQAIRRSLYQELPKPVHRIAPLVLDAGVMISIADSGRAEALGADNSPGKCTKAPQARPP